MAAFVIEKLCSGCGQCARACPQQAINVIASSAVVNPELCIDCETCLENCLNGAITFV